MREESATCCEAKGGVTGVLTGAALTAGAARRPETATVIRLPIPVLKDRAARVMGVLQMVRMQGGQTEP
ncbi:hypothetical protein GCM10028800_00150 [Nesterenkonia populi]